MMPNITKGSRVRGVLEYLWGPGKSNEHADPHVIAGYDDPALLDPPRDSAGRADLAGLAARLDAPQKEAGKNGLKNYVWQCSLSLPAEEGELSDEQWRQIATRFVAEMGFAGTVDQLGCRWVGVRHGLSVNGNDHIHLVVTLATEAGKPVWLRWDYRLSQQVCDQLEDEFGLRKWSPGRSKATKRRGTTQSEMAQSRRTGTEPVRQRLRRMVRAALAGARSEQEWVERMHAAGIVTRPRVGSDGTVVGYSVSHPDDPDVGFAGSTLDGELSLPRIRERFDGPPLTEAQWTGASGRDITLSDPGRGQERAQVWRAAARSLEEVSARLGQLPSDSGQWVRAAQACADALVQIAAVADPDARTRLSRAADALARACAPPSKRAAPVASAVVAQLGAVSRGVRLAGRPRDPAEASLVLTVVVAAARLAVIVAQLREAQADAAAAGAARAAARGLVEFLAAASASPTATGHADPAPATAPAQANSSVAPAEPTR